MKSIQSTHIVFHGRQQLGLEKQETPAPTANQVLIRTLCSLMSTGTENIVFNQLYDRGTHWDHWVKYPFYPGYAVIGEVESAGPEATSLKPGDRVATRIGHGSHHLREESDCYPIPEDLPSGDASWFAMGKIAFQGAKAAEYRIGDDVVIIGAGPIGQMTLRWARAAGAGRVIMIDPVPDREPFARSAGVYEYLAMQSDEAKEKVRALLNGALPRVVVDTTGHPAVFASALGLAGHEGRVVVLGDTGTPAKQSLTGDIIGKRLTIIGAHDGHPLPGWTESSIVELFFRLAGDGRFPLKDLNTHEFRPDQYAEAYETANREREKTMGILFNWSEA